MLSRPQGHCAIGKITSKKNYNDTIGNRTRDLPVFSAVPQPTAPPREAVKRYNYREETDKDVTKGKQRKEIKR